MTTQINITEQTGMCSGVCCVKIGIRFDASTWMFACEEHADKWRKQMIDVGLSCLTSQPMTTRDARCAKCTFSGYYMINGVGYCFRHADVGAVAGYIDIENNVKKIILARCENNHKWGVHNNETFGCYLCN